MTTTTTPTTTKECPRCGNRDLGLMRSLNLKVCTDCNVWIHWKLDPGQKSLHADNRKEKE